MLTSWSTFDFSVFTLANALMPGNFCQQENTDVSDKKALRIPQIFFQLLQFLWLIEDDFNHQKEMSHSGRIKILGFRFYSSQDYPSDTAVFTTNYTQITR